MPRLIGTFSITLALLVSAATIVADETPAGGTTDRQAALALLKQLETDYAAGDAKGLANCWTENGEFVGPSGARMNGRPEIEKQFQDAFAAGKQGKLEFHLLHFRLASDHLALVEALAEVKPAVASGGAPLASFVLVKQDDRWLIESAHEMVAHLPADASHLKELEWMIGQWASATSPAGLTLRTACDWTANHAFLIRKFTTRGKEAFLHGGTEVIGWDPRTSRIRSWVFDSDGGFGENVWVRDGGHWLIKFSGTLADGSEASATHILTRVDADTMMLQSKDRVINGTAQPDVPETELKRQTTTKPEANPDTNPKPETKSGSTTIKSGNSVAPAAKTTP